MHAAGRPCAPLEAESVVADEAVLAKSAREAAPTTWLRGRGFGFGLGAAGSAALACAPPNAARAGLKQAVIDAESALGADAELAVVFSTHALPCASIYYVPLANDARGIGYQHTDAREVFDDTPEQRLEGVAFLNDWPYWQLRLDELESAFNHELGHRWGARVHARLDGVESSALLGRGQDHWSYFLDSQGSPLEGNVWRAAASGRISDTPTFPAQFSALDRYLMGIATPAEVAPFELLIEPGASARDCNGRVVVPASPPQTCGALELEARAVSVSIQNVIDAEGAREPAPAAVTRQVGVLPLVLSSGDTSWSAAECESLARALEERIAGFEHASAGRLRLVNALGGSEAGVERGMACDELSRSSLAVSAGAGAPRAGTSTRADALPPAERPSCAASPRTSPGASCLSGMALALLALGRGLGRRARRTLGSRNRTLV